MEKTYITNETYYTENLSAYMYHINSLDVHEHYMYCNYSAMLV